MAKSAIVSGAQLSHISRGDDPPYPPRRASAREDVVSLTISYRAEAPVALPRLPGSAALSFRAFRCWLLMYQRTWRASVWSSVFGPLFYLGAMGYGLGSLVDKNGTATLGGVPYVVYVAPA